MTINLEPIKVQLAKDIGGHICLHRDDMAGLVAEVEHLRDEADLIRAGLEATRAYADRLEREVLYLRGDRAAVVAFLREYAVPRKIDPDVLVLLPPGATVVSHFADAIERGEHRREEEE